MGRTPHYIWRNAPPIDPNLHPNRIRLERGDDWFADGSVARYVGGQGRGNLDGSYTAGSRMSPGLKLTKWQEFRRTYVWDEDMTKEVFIGWHSKLCGRISDTVYKVRHVYKRNEPVPYMDEDGRNRMDQETQTEGFAKRSRAGKANRAKKKENCQTHGGSVSAASFVKKEAAKGNFLNLSDVHAHIHCGKDAQGNPIWSSDASKELDEKFKEQCQNLGIELGSPQARDVYYKLSGGYKPKDKSVYGLGSATKIFFEVPPSGQGSSSRNSGPTPSMSAILADRLTAQDSIIAQLQSQLTQLTQQQQAGSSQNHQSPPHP